MKPPIAQDWTGKNAFVPDEHIPALDYRDENGRGDGKHANKEKEDIASHQNQLPAHVQRSVSEEVCSIDVEPARAEKRDKERGKKQSVVAFQHNMGNAKEIGVGLSTWSFKHVGIKAY